MPRVLTSLLGKLPAGRVRFRVVLVGQSYDMVSGKMFRFGLVFLVEISCKTEVYGSKYMHTKSYVNSTYFECV